MTRPKVTDAERRQARLQDHDRAAVERIGIAAAGQIGFHAQAAAVAAVRRGLDPIAIVKKALRGALPLLTEAMVAGHLTGRRRALTTISKLPGKLVLRAEATAYGNALEVLRKRLKMTPEELARVVDLYQAQALTVLKAAEAHAEEVLQETILKTATAGEHVREGVKALSEAFDRLGLTPNNSFTLEALFRTQTAMAYSAGRYNEERDPAIQEILWGYKYATVGDDRVRPEHVGFDGVTLPKDDSFWGVNMPPNGWCCRCTALSIFEKRAEVGPQTVDVDGKMVAPVADPGFRFNPGNVWAAA